MSLSRLAKVAVGLTVGASTGMYAPQGAWAQPAALRSPQFVTTAVRFKALDETGWDWTGSDEVYAVFSDLDPTHGDLTTSTFGDVDSGESRDFPPTEQCIAPRPRCDRGLPSIHFKLALWERDKLPGVFVHGELTGVHNHLENGLEDSDDLIGNAEVTKPTEELLSELPTV